MKIVLIRGCDQYHYPGISLIHLGWPVEVSDDIGRELLLKTGPAGSLFIRAEDMDHREVELRLKNPNRSFRTGAIYAEPGQPARVPASLVPYLLEKRCDGEPVFEIAGPVNQVDRLSS